MADVSVFQSIGIGFETGLNPEVSPGHSLPSTDTSQHFLEKSFEPSELYQQQDLHQPLENQQLYLTQVPQQNQDATHCQDPATPPKQSSTPEESQEQQHNSAGAQSIGTGMETVLNQGIEMGNFLPSPGASDNEMEKVLERSEVAQQRHLHHLLLNEQLHQDQEQQQSQEFQQDPSALPKQFSSPEQCEQQQPDQATIQKLEIQMEIGLNPLILEGHSLASTNISDNVVEAVFEHFGLHEKHQQHQPVLQQKPHHEQQHQQQSYDITKYPFASPEQSQQKQRHSVEFESLRIEMETQLSSREQSEQQQSHSADVDDSLGIGIEIGLNPGIVTHSLPSTDASHILVESKFEQSKLDEKQQQNQPQGHEQEQQEVQDVTQHRLAPARKLSSPEKSQQQEPNTTSFERLMDNGIGVYLNPGTVIGRSVPSTDTSEREMETVVKPSELDQQQHQRHLLLDQHFYHQQPPSAGVEIIEIIEIGVEIDSTSGIVIEPSLPSRGTSDSVVENKLEPCELDQHQQQSHLFVEEQQFCHANIRVATPCFEANEDAAALAYSNIDNERLRQSEAFARKLKSSVEELVQIGQSVTCSTAVSEATSSEASVWSESGHNTKLNPFAEEFITLSRSDTGSISLSNASSSNGKIPSKNVYDSRGKKKRAKIRRNRAQREGIIRRTIYVSHLPNQFSEEQVAALFITVGQVVDCRIWADPNSSFRFGFVEFTEEYCARAALRLSGSVVGHFYPAYPMYVMPSKTAIVPVNPSFLPQSEEEKERCTRTIYCKNIDEKLSQADVKLIFERLCGKIAQLRLLEDSHDYTKIAFVEFVMAESAMSALTWSGVIFGSLPIRVSPSKTPVRFP